MHSVPKSCILVWNDVVGVAQRQSTGLWNQMLRVRNPSPTHGQTLERGAVMPPLLFVCRRVGGSWGCRIIMGNRLALGIVENGI